MFAIRKIRRYNKSMYLVSLYFDEKTNQIIRGHMQCAADASGNTDMLDKAVPPHITLTVFESKESEQRLTEKLDKVMMEKRAGELMWVSVAAFFPQVLYLSPVLNEYLHDLSVSVCQEIETFEGARVQECYKPFNWQPHATVARKLTAEEMQKAFQGLQSSFRPFRGSVVRIGLSEGTRKRELKSWMLETYKEE